jgi:hypothetical protein
MDYLPQRNMPEYPEDLLFALPHKEIAKTDPDTQVTQQMILKTTQTALLLVTLNSSLALLRSITPDKSNLINQKR